MSLAELQLQVGELEGAAEALIYLVIIVVVIILLFKLLSRA